MANTKAVLLRTAARPIMASAGASINQADARVRITGAPLLPAIDGNASKPRTRASLLPGRTGTPRQVGSRFTDLYVANLSASYMLDFWGQNRAALLASEQVSI